MGRGERGQAITEAKSLLYGKRQSVTRSSNNSSPSEPVSFQGLNQEQYVDNLIKLTASLGLSKPLPFSEQKRLCKDVEAGPIEGQIVIDIKQSDDHQMRLVINTNGKDNGIGAYYVPSTSGASIALEAGDRLGDPENSRIEELGARLKELGVQRFAYKAKPITLQQRLDRGEPIELDAGHSVLDRSSEADWPRVKSQAKHLIHLAYNDELISAEEEAGLTEIMNSLDHGDPVLARLAEDPIGRSVIHFSSDLYISEELNN